MLEFKQITLSDKTWMRELFAVNGFGSEEFNYTFCYTWQHVFSYRAARIGDILIIKSFDEEAPNYLYPVGRGDAARAIESMIEDAGRSGHEFVMHAVLAEQVSELGKMFPGRFAFEPVRKYFDYVYASQDLISLKGKKYHSKRNHINRFVMQYTDWRYEQITPENIREVAEMNNDWCLINADGDQDTLEDETCAVRMTLRDYFSLDIDGGLIRAGGRVVAFSVGERLNSDTYLVHIEKAFGDVTGAYTIINQQFAENNCAGYEYINREDDSGQEGLRKAKQSYHPVKMVEKFDVTLL